MVLEGAEIRCVIYCDKVKTTMRSLNLSAGARNCCCCCGVKKLTIFDPSHFNVKRGCGEIPRDLSQKSVTLTWQQRDNSLFQLPLNITGALSASHEEDHFADSPWYYCDQGWGPWHWHRIMWETEKLRGEKRIVVEFLRTLIKKLTMTRVSFIEKWLQI